MNVNLTDRIIAELPKDVEEPPSRARDTSNLIFVGKTSCTLEENGVQFLRDARAGGFIKYISDSRYKLHCLPAKSPRAFAKFDIYLEELKSPAVP